MRCACNGAKDPASGQMKMSEIPGSEFEMDCDLLLLAMGFLGPVKKGMLEELGVALDAQRQCDGGCQ